MHNIIWTSTCPDRLVHLPDTATQRWFSGTDYLGLAHFEPLQEYLKEGIAVIGTHYGSSRNNTLRLSIYEQAEELLAQYMQVPKALTVSSGMLAGQLLIQHLPTIVREPYQVHYAPRVHPAIAGPTYSAREQSWNDWAAEIIACINQDYSDTLHVIITDAIGSPWVEEYDFSLWSQLQHAAKVLFIIDDSHGIGITGVNGNGIGSILKLPKMIVSSLNKALGIAAGVIAGEEVYINRLFQIGLFSGASPMAPMYAYALVKMLENNWYPQRYGVLQKRLTLVAEKGLFASKSWTSINHYPAFCSYRKDIHQVLLQRGIITSCFAYPTVHDAPVVRLVVNAAHTEEDIEVLIAALHNN